MENSETYIAFLKNNGRPLSEINPGSDETALTVNQALEALELLRVSTSPIVGGDVLSEENGRLVYAYQSWGSEYHCLNWSCNKEPNETQTEYAIRSYVFAKESIKT